MSSRPTTAPNEGAPPKMDVSPTGVAVAAGDALECLAANLARVRARIDRAAAASGRAPGSVRLLAVTKYTTAEGVAALMELGLRDFGENYVQAALAKLEATAILHASRSHLASVQGATPVAASDPARWHLIGPLQTNKAHLIPGRFASVRTIDRVKVADALARFVGAARLRLAVQIQVNTTLEATKSGVSPEGVRSLARAVEDTGVLDLDGLMTIGPTDGTSAAAAEAFRTLDRAARDLEHELGRPMARSMGMSHDLEAAVASGATEVRIGSALFEGLPELRADEASR